MQDPLSHHEKSRNREAGKHARFTSYMSRFDAPRYRSPSTLSRSELSPAYNRPHPPTKALKQLRMNRTWPCPALVSTPFVAPSLSSERQFLVVVVRCPAAKVDAVSIGSNRERATRRRALWKDEVRDWKVGNSTRLVVSGWVIYAALPPR